MPGPSLTQRTLQFFGLERSMNPVSDSRGWYPIVREPYTGAWQRNDEWTVDTVVAHHAVFSCITLIASDIAKLRPKLVELTDDGIWVEVDRRSPFSLPLRRPNRFQNHIQFKEWWTISKLSRGNAYVLKERDERGVVRALYLLDPSRVTVLVSDDGSVFYSLNQDNLAGVDASNVVVPASEIIHDRMNCLFHPLVGVSPIFASGAAANIGLQIESNSANFFGSGSNPGGLLIAPTPIKQEDADRLSHQWQQKFSGPNSGRVAVVGGLGYQPLRMSAVDSQLIEQLKWTAETVCSAFHVPPFKVGVGGQPTYANGEIRDGNYYSDCLQYHIESMEAALDEGLGLDTTKDGRWLGVELDLDGLLRMDTATLVTSLVEGLKGVYAPNEARRKLDLPPVPGGDTPYLQQQNFSLEALNKRDTGEDPFATAKPEAAPEADTQPASEAPVTRAWAFLFARDAAEAEREALEIAA